LAVWLVEGCLKMAPGYEKVDLSLVSVACVRWKTVNEFDYVMSDRKYVNIHGLLVHQTYHLQTFFCGVI
jgi:hypothetical protein